MDVIRKLLSQIYDRIHAWLHGSSPATLQLTGILGLALVIIGYYHFKGGNDAPRQQARPHSEGHDTNSRGTAAANASSPSSSREKEKKVPAAVVRDSPVARSVAAKLQGVQRVTLSCPGVLLQQWQTEQLHESATLWPGVAEVLKEMCFITEVYLISQVTDDIGEALVSGALEAAGVTGTGPGQVPPHRLLFCSTLEGKVAMTRQLEPELHVEALHATSEELRRFLPQLWHVQQASAPEAIAAPNVAKAASLMQFFGL